jgi:hypothetical protein
VTVTIWSTARQARRERSRCPEWCRLSEACILFVCGVTWRTAVPVALLVGRLLSAVNQGAVIADGASTAGVWVRVALNYAVPFVVSSAGFLAAGRVRPDHTVATDVHTTGTSPRG